MNEKLSIALAQASHRAALIGGALSRLARDAENDGQRRELLGIADSAHDLVQRLGEALISERGGKA